MDQYLEKEPATRRIPPPAYVPSVVPPEPSVTTSSASEFSTLQSGIGNAAIVGAVSNGSVGVSSNAPQLQSGLGNSALQRVQGFGQVRPASFEQEPAPPAMDTGFYPSEDI